VRGGPSCPAVLLIPGWSDGGRSLERAGKFLIESGWPPGAVSVVDFRDRFGSNVDHASEIAEAVSRLRDRSGQPHVAAVAHSMGGLALRLYLATSAGAAAVDAAVFVGTPHRGTWMAWLAWGAGGAEMRPGSALLQRLEATPLPSGIRSCCIRTPIDSRILPPSSAWLPYAECRTVHLPRHSVMMRHLPTLRIVRDFLLERDSRTLRGAA
jgi:triacylglycerol lipase